MKVTYINTNIIQSHDIINTSFTNTMDILQEYKSNNNKTKLQPAADVIERGDGWMDVQNI